MSSVGRFHKSHCCRTPRNATHATLPHSVTVSAEKLSTQHFPNFPLFVFCFSVVFCIFIPFYFVVFLELISLAELWISVEFRLVSFSHIAPLPLAINTLPLPHERKPSTFVRRTRIGPAGVLMLFPKTFWFINSFYIPNMKASHSLPVWQLSWSHRSHPH